MRRPSITPPGFRSRITRRFLLLPVQFELDGVPQPRGTARTRAPGPDPDRVLLIGNGIAVGFGVVSHDLALAGHLARELESRTGHGVDVDVRAVRGLTLQRTARLLDTVRLDRYDAIVLAVGSTDAYGLLPARTHAANVAALLDSLHAALCPGVEVVVCGVYPVQRRARQAGLVSRIVDRHVEGMDEAVERLCASRSWARFFRADRVVTDPPRDIASYAAIAAALANEVVAALDSGRCDGGGAVSRSAADPEEARLAALKGSGIGPAGSPALHHLVSTIRAQLQVDAAAVMIVDREVVRVKAASGIEGPTVPRAIAPCSRTIAGDGVLVLPDLRSEPIGAEGWRYYAGHPLETPSGYRVGTLCLLHRSEYTIDPRVLAHLAWTVEQELWNEAVDGPDVAIAGAGGRRTSNGRGDRADDTLEAVHGRP